jgi:hypothetical protein
MTLLFGNTEHIMCMVVSCLLRTITKETGVADKLGPILVAQLDMQRKMNLVQMLVEELCTEALKARIVSWRKGMESAVTRRNNFAHSAWMLPLDIGNANTVRLKRSGYFVFNNEAIPTDIKTLCDDLGILNNGLVQCLADLGSLPRVQEV